MTSISNASPIIALERIGRLDLLEPVWGPVTIPPAVRTELGTGWAMPSWCQVCMLQQPIPGSFQALSLGPGETEAIALALETGGALLILDDQKARNLAVSLGLAVTGTLGALLEAKVRGKLQAIKDLLVDLRKTGFHISNWLYARTLQDAGEQP